MKLLACPICGRQPGETTIVYGNGVRLHIISCKGFSLLDALMKSEGNEHELLTTGKKNTKRDAAKSWNKIAQDHNKAITQ